MYINFVICLCLYCAVCGVHDIAHIMYIIHEWQQFPYAGTGGIYRKYTTLLVAYKNMHHFANDRFSQSFLDEMLLDSP